MGNTFTTIAQVAVSTALVVGGAVATAASFGGASVVGAAMISAGVSGATTAITSGKSASWKSWGTSVGIGAATGFVGGCIGVGAGALAKGLTTGVEWAKATVLATKAACIIGGSTTASVACNAMSNVFQGRNAFDGVGTTMVTGLVGGVFACGSTAAAHSMKRSAFNFFKNPFTRHGASVAIDTIAATTTGVVGAGMSGQDVGTAAWIGALTGGASGALVASIRGSAKHQIRKMQARERLRAAQLAPIQGNRVTFDFEQGPQMGHRDERHIDRHHTSLKQRLVEEPNIPASSRFKDRRTGDHIRQKIAEEYTLPPEVTDAQDQHAFAVQQKRLADATVTACTATFEAKKTPENLQQLQAALAAKAVGGVRVRDTLAHLRTEVNNMRDHNFVELNTVSNKGFGYGYHRGGSTATGPTREFNIKNASGWYAPSVDRNGVVTFRERTLFPNYVPGGRLKQIQQNMYAGDRQFRHRAHRADLVQRSARQYREYDEETTLSA